MTQTVVIGLDGANWSLIERWFEEGRLPNLNKLRSQGAHGISQSRLPPVTCPNWKCYATGKNPGKLGVYWWEQIDTEEQTMHLPDSTDFDSPEIWDYLNEQGQDAGVINLPMTYPPREIDQFMVAGGPRSREKDYTHPAELEQELEERFDYRVHPENVLTSNEDSEREVEMVHDILRMRLRTAHTLIEERDVDLLHVTLFHLNVLQHYFWDGEPTKRAYEIIDEELEPFIEGDYNLVLMSDHGCTEIDTVFYINSWLEEKGYLQTKESLSSRLYDVGITQEQIAGLVRKVGLEKYIRPLVPRAIIERFPSDEGVVREEKLSMVDWEHTTAIGSGQGLVYTVADSEAEREEILQDLEEDLRAERANGEALVCQIYRREDLYNGEHVDKAPDLVFDQRPGVHTSEAMGRDVVFTEPTNWQGENVPEGMFLFHGKDVKAVGHDEIQITDIAPTILHWLGHQIPTDMDGSPVLEVFREGSEPAERPIETRSPLHDTDAGRDLHEDVEDRLSDIGHLE
jgi:predicted AlkP superfamily phosphohydrolase/phosphomutase